MNQTNEDKCELSPFPIFLSIVSLVFVGSMTVCVIKNRLELQFSSGYRAGVEDETKRWQKLLAEQDHAFYDGKTGEWKLKDMEAEAVPLEIQENGQQKKSFTGKSVK